MKKHKRYICIHGHYYQPPRENAWLESIEVQDSAAPFHDWNERINFECYAPNASARILDEQSNILKIVNNYAKISFNVGPTLLSWMQAKDTDTYNAILAADKISTLRFGGHGSAIAQVHSHIILPLANAHDKSTQVIWGIKDFEYRFGRKPEGMWLAETAVNTESLETLAANDIKFTILAPRQAKSFRRIGEEQNWIENQGIDTRRAYLCNLPSGKTIVLFFYDGTISQEVAFNGLLNNGKAFAHRFMSCFSNNNEPQLVNIATDGESYGHHHRYGEMALADCLESIDNSDMANLINYGQFLELFPPEYEVQIHENSSWSCVHGVERWRSDCGCNSGRPGWHQRWRAPLRNALNWLRDSIIPIFEKEAGELVHDIWATRNDYIEVILDRSDENLDAFIEKHAKKAFLEEDKIKLLRLLEMQRNAILMFTSCGWFFDEVSGMETHQILQYACRAISYAKQVSNEDFHEEFVQRLALAPSNVFENGAESYQKHVVPSMVDLKRVGIHYAVASLFERNPSKIATF